MSHNLDVRWPWATTLAVLTDPANTPSPLGRNPTRLPAARVRFFG